MYDTVVIGSGFGGLASALRLAEARKKVILCEALKYPGGCASTFEKNGLRFEAGATLFSGFGPDQLFTRWCAEHYLPVSFSVLSPAVSFRTFHNNIPIYPNREKTIAEFCALPNAPTTSIQAFFSYQQKIADVLWPVFDDPYRLPPFSFAGLWWHITRSWKYLSLLPIINTPLIKILRRFGLSEFSPIVNYCNALCQITIQTDAMHAEAPFALCAMDYIFRGTGHIENGIGTLANAMVQRIQELGGEVRMPARVQKITPNSHGWNLQLRKDNIETKSVIANLLPSALDKILDMDLPSHTQHIQEQVESGWGAVMLYLIIKDDPSLPRHPHHIQCIGDEDVPLQEGNHIFCSLGGAGEQADPNLRTATVSTHISMNTYQNHSDIPSFIHNIQEKMKQILHKRAPEIYAQTSTFLPASPRTFARFTSRSKGCVGGIPRVAGWHNYQGLFPKPVYPHLWLVGDSVFPGQSTLSTAVGGYRTANAVLRRLS